MSLDTIQFSIDVKKAQIAAAEDEREKARIQAEIDALEEKKNEIS